MEDFQQYVEGSIPDFMEVSVEEEDTDGQTIIEVSGEDSGQTYRAEIPEPNHDDEAMADITDMQIVSIVTRITEAAMESNMEEL